MALQEQDNKYYINSNSEKLIRINEQFSFLVFMPPLKYSESLMLYSVNCKLFPSNLIFPFLGFEKHHIESAQNTVETNIEEGMYFQLNIHI